MTRRFRMTMLLAALAGVGTFVVADAAQAASCSAAEASEMRRLRDELRKLAQKNAHSGVVSTFNQMLKLSKQKCELVNDDYRIAAGAARSLGNIDDAIDWYTSGGATSEVANLKSRFGQVKISEKPGDLVKQGGLPFPPDERATVEAASKALKAKGKYEGYLPLGVYRLGAKAFEVKASGVTKV